jgi:hypothetical protein
MRDFRKKQSFDLALQSAAFGWRQSFVARPPSSRLRCVADVARGLQNGGGRPLPVSHDRRLQGRLVSPIKPRPPTHSDNEHHVAF